MNNVNIRELQMKLLKIMKAFHEICNKHNIRYYMLVGTMLGAIRHKDFILWDYVVCWYSKNWLWKVIKIIKKNGLKKLN